MEEKYDFTANYASLKKCERIYGKLFYYYIVSSILLLLYSFINLVCIGIDANLIMKAGAEPLAPNYLLLLIDAIVFAPLTAFLGCKLALHKHDLSAILLTLFIGINLGLFLYNRKWAFFDRVPIAFWLFVLYNTFALAGAVIGFRTNLKYHWLEKQPGFPIFNERLEEQNVKIDQFQCEYNRLRRTSTDTMEELPLPKDHPDKM